MDADLHLTENFWRNNVEDFGRCFEAAHIKMLARYWRIGVKQRLCCAYSVRPRIACTQCSDKQMLALYAWF